MSFFGRLPSACFTSAPVPAPMSPNGTAMNGVSTVSRAPTPRPVKM